MANFEFPQKNGGVERDFYDDGEKYYETPMTEEEVFNAYLEDLGLTKDDLKNRHILDIGAGATPAFVGYCLTHNITDNIYGIDIERYLSGWKHYTEEGKERYPKEKWESQMMKNHYIQAKGENLPFKPETFDIIVCRAALWGIDLNRLFNEISFALKPGGEFRAGPIWRGESEFRDAIETAAKKYIPQGFEFEWKEGKLYISPNKNESEATPEEKPDYRDFFIFRKVNKNLPNEKSSQ